MTVLTFRHYPKSLSFTYSTREDDKRKVFREGTVSPDKAMILEKSRSWVNITRCSFLAVAIISSSEDAQA